MFQNINLDTLALLSDIHLGDEKHAKDYSLGMVEYADEVISRINNQINKDTTLILIGDTICDPNYIPYLKNINCKKLICIIGNRESRQPEIISTMVAEGYGCQSSILINGVLLTHIPPHSSEALRFRKVIHGHLHFDRIYNSLYVNVAAPITKFKVTWYKDI